jgi:hypothetical protein
MVATPEPVRDRLRCEVERLSDVLDRAALLPGRADGLHLELVEPLAHLGDRLDRPKDNSVFVACRISEREKASSRGGCSPNSAVLRRI